MRSPLMGFTEFCRDELGLQDIGDLEPADVCRYSEDLYDRTKIDEEISASTAQTYFAYVRAFLSWCVRDQLLETNPGLTSRGSNDRYGACSRGSDRDMCEAIPISGEMANVHLVDWNGNPASQSPNTPEVHIDYGVSD